MGVCCIQGGILVVVTRLNPQMNLPESLQVTDQLLVGETLKAEGNATLWT